jgi:prepilin-type N-terminal cleavage/methylation domain-containing protein
MKLNTKKAASFGDVRGLTLIEVLVAMAILSVMLISMAIMISVGFLQMNNMRIQRAAANCARMVMEYLETMPPDVIYGWSKQTALNGNFASGGVTQLNAFINSGGDTTCRKLSDASDPLGKKVKLRYTICPGCYSTTQLDNYGQPGTTCIYFARVRISYNGLNLGHNQTVEYPAKFFTGQDGTCIATPNGCGASPVGLLPGTLKDCILP